MNGFENMNDSTLLEDFKETSEYCLKYKESLQNSTVFVTGATGLVGSQIVKSLLFMNGLYNTGIKVIAGVRDTAKADSVFGGFAESGYISYHVGDIKDEIKIDGGIDYIFHTASVTSSKFFVTKPVETIDIAVIGTKNVLELAKEKNVRGIVYVSSMEAFGIPDPSLNYVCEKDLGYIDILNVRSSYSEGKRICECMCAAYFSEYGVPVKIARLAQTFGAGVSREDTRAFAQFARSSIAGEDIILHTRGNSFGNYCYTADAVRGLFTIIFDGENGEAYTVANESTAMPIEDVAALVAKTLSGGKSQVVFDIPDSPLTYGYAPDVKMRLSAEKLEKLGWKPEFDLAEMFIRLSKSWGKVD